MEGSFRALMGPATESAKESRCVGRSWLREACLTSREPQGPLAPRPVQVLAGFTMDFHSTSEEQ
jgi:hypothetical protein